MKLLSTHINKTFPIRLGLLYLSVTFKFSPREVKDILIFPSQLSIIFVVENDIFINDFGFQWDDLRSFEGLFFWFHTSYFNKKFKRAVR